jgi:hypothetical protein
MSNRAVTININYAKPAAFLPFITLRFTRPSPRDCPSPRKLTAKRAIQNGGQPPLEPISALLLLVLPLLFCALTLTALFGD